jgi:hypothetical protein
LNIDEHAAKSIPDLIKLLSPMHTGLGGSVTGAQEEAYRQAIQCLIGEKLTAVHINTLNELNESINNLNHSTTKLTKVGWILTGLITLASVLIPLYPASGAGD